jgi:hypothetical protein
MSETGHSLGLAGPRRIPVYPALCAPTAVVGGFRRTASIRSNAPKRTFGCQPSRRERCLLTATGPLHIFTC